MDRLQAIIDALKGAPESTAALLSGMAAQPVAGLHGLGALLTGQGPDAAARQVERTQNALTFEPRSQTGKESLANLGQTMAPVGEAMDFIPSKLGEIDPAAGASLAAVMAVADPSKIAGKVGRVGKAAARAATLAEESPIRQQIAQAMDAKAAREASLAKKVAAAAEAPDVPVEGTRNKKFVKQDPDVYRQMYAEGGMEPVLKSAGAGEHLKRNPDGSYVGAPRTVTNPSALGAMRKSIDEQFNTGANVLAHADPERVGTWYDRAKESMLQSTEPHQLPTALGEHAVYSAGASPETELVFALKHGASRAVGAPVKAGRPGPMQTLDKAAAEARLPQLGHKTGEYFNKIDPRQEDAGPFGVNDFRAAQGFGYTDPQGNPWKAGASATMHPFMDAETALANARANKAGVGGRSDWTGPQQQEIPWVLGKAQDYYGRTPEAKGPLNTKAIDRMVEELKKANNTTQDYIYKHAVSATHEAVPGASTGHVPGVLSAPFETRKAYGEKGRWDTPSPMAGGDDAARDELHRALGFRQLPAAESAGAYMNSKGQLESNPMTISRPLVAMEQGGSRVDPQVAKTLDAIEQFRAAMDAQEAGAWNLPNTGAAVKGKNALVMDTRRPLGMLGPTDPALGAQASPEALARLNELVGEHGYGAGATGRGVSIFPFDPSTPSSALATLLKSKGSQLQTLMPGARMEKSVTSSGYVPGIGKWGDDGIVPTAPFSGEATSGVLQSMANLPAKVARDLGESEGIRSAIRAKIERDAALPGARKDIQNMRNFFRESDSPKAVELMRSGMKPAAALAALGYSLNSMAGQEPEVGR